MEPSEVVLRFLDSLGRRADAEFYLSLFRNTEKERFAILAIDAPVLNDALDAVALDCRFLTTLGLMPILAVGVLEPDIDHEQARRMRSALSHNGIKPEIVPLSANIVDRLKQTLRDGRIAIVPFGMAEGLDASERLLTLGHVVAELKTRKVIFVGRRGGLQGADGHILPAVNLSTEFDEITLTLDMTVKQRQILNAARQLLCERISHRCTVALTSPFDVLRELFTLRGAGTLLRRGARITCFRNFERLDKERFRQLLDSAFGRSLQDGFFERSSDYIYLDDEYRGTAVINDTPLGAYLSKFAVEKEAQGEGIGRDLWEMVVSHHPTLFWRSRHDNPIDAWYVQQCDGMVRLPNWHVFWKGFSSAAIPAAIDYAMAQPSDFSSK